MYPLIEINLKNIIENYKYVNNVCNKNGVTLSLVTKLLSGNKDIVLELVNNGVKCICESRIENLMIYSDIDVEKWLIRSPMISEVCDVVKYADVSLNTEIKVINKLDEEAKKQNKIHKIILMYELGDLREGLLKEDLDIVINECLKLKNIELYGIGTNLSCYGEIVPSIENMSELSKIVNYFEEKYDIKFKIISGGNSSSYDMLKNGLLNKKVNNLRMGEAIFLGNLPCFESPIEELNRDNFILKTEIIELKTKPSVPWGNRGLCNSFGEDTVYEDRGNRKRAIVALGKQDVNISGLYPTDKDIIILGGSSDHIILDVDDSKVNYKVGDIIEFKLNYSSVLTLMTSQYVKRRVIN